MNRRTVSTLKATTFICPDCGRERSIKALSRGTLAQAGTNNPEEAMLTLPECELLCQTCENKQADEVAGCNLSFGRTPVERFEFDGITPDPGKLAAWLLNY